MHAWLAYYLQFHSPKLEQSEDQPLLVHTGDLSPERVADMHIMLVHVRVSTVHAQI